MNVIQYVGLDVHNDSIAISIAPSDSTEVRRWGIVGGTHEQDTADYSKPILQVEKLTTRFDVGKTFFGRVTHRVHAVEEVSFDIYPGETLALVGGPVRDAFLDLAWKLSQLRDDAAALDGSHSAAC